MNALVPDAADHFKSLDDVYYFGGQEPHYHVAVLPHTAKTPQEMNLKVGDILTIAGNHWDGYSKGSNLRSQVYASLFPSFKVSVNALILFHFAYKFVVPIEIRGTRIYLSFIIYL